MKAERRPPAPSSCLHPTHRNVDAKPLLLRHQLGKIDGEPHSVVEEKGGLARDLSYHSVSHIKETGISHVSASLLMSTVQSILP